MCFLLKQHVKSVSLEKGQLKSIRDFSKIGSIYLCWETSLESIRTFPSVGSWQQVLDMRNPVKNSFVSCPWLTVPQRMAVCVLAGFPLPINQMKIYRGDTNDLVGKENQQIRAMTQTQETLPSNCSEREIRGCFPSRNNTIKGCKFQNKV